MDAIPVLKNEKIVGSIKLSDDMAKYLLAEMVENKSKFMLSAEILISENPEIKKFYIYEAL